MFAIIGAWLIYQYQNKDAMGKDVFESMYKKAIVATAFGFVLSELGPIDDWLVNFTTDLYCGCWMRVLKVIRCN